MKIETRIHLDRFKPRPYQIPILDAILNKGYKKVIAILPRRAGKDLTAWNVMIRAAVMRVGVYFYVFPTYSMGRKILWDSITNDGQRILDYLPEELIASKNEQQMRIRLTNGSMIQVIGSDNYDNSLVGTNPLGIVWSEYALTDPRAYQFARPILTANDGWSLMISTPRGKNHLWELYQIAIHNPDWFAYKLTVEDTQHISLADIEKERQELSDDLIMQEYYTSFEMGVEGAFYAKYLDRMRLKGQVGQVPWEPGFKVNTAWDIGVRDSTSIIFFQVVGQTVRIIECYEKSKEGLEHYINILESKPYSYGKHIAPHDIRVREFGSGITRWEKARQLGVTFTMSNDVGLMDGIEAVRTTLPKVWIDEKNAGFLVKALENYRQEYDSKKKIYKSQPLHNEFSHMADAMRYLCVSLPKTRDGLSAEELDRRYNEAMYGQQSTMPAVFRTDLPEY